MRRTPLRPDLHTLFRVDKGGATFRIVNYFENEYVFYQGTDHEKVLKIDIDGNASITEYTTVDELIRTWNVA